MNDGGYGFVNWDAAALQEPASEPVIAVVPRAETVEHISVGEVVQRSLVDLVFFGMNDDYGSDIYRIVCETACGVGEVSLRRRGS